MSADPAVWLRAADEAEQRLIGAVAPTRYANEISALAGHLRAAAGEVTRLAALEQAARQINDQFCHDWHQGHDWNDTWIDVLMPLYQLLGDTVGSSALLAGAGDAEGGE